MAGYQKNLYSSIVKKIELIYISTIYKGEHIDKHKAHTHIHAVALHRDRLVLGWLTAFGQVNCLIT